jgi:hypothetical protein
MKLTLEFNKDLIWVNDWTGEDLGIEDFEGTIGEYLLVGTDIHLHIDMDKMTVFDAFLVRDDTYE